MVPGEENSATSQLNLVQSAATLLLIYHLALNIGAEIYPRKYLRTASSQLP
jgi:hypothetical protein